MGTGKLLGKPNKLRKNDLRWTSILSRERRNTPSRFMLQKPGISSGSYGPLGSKGFIGQGDISSPVDSPEGVVKTDDLLMISNNSNNSNSSRRSNNNNNNNNDNNNNNNKRTH